VLVDISEDAAYLPGKQRVAADGALRSHRVCYLQRLPNLLE
jgi:hypothetical protein